MQKPDTPVQLDTFNDLAADAALALVTHWCAAPQWAESVCSARPFSTIAHLGACCAELWSSAAEADRLAAFAAHPVIGDVELLRSKYAGQAHAEQGQVLAASEATLTALAEQNAAYSKRHGFTFIVFATNKSADEMLDLLQERINNSTADELNNAAAEQLKILQLRMAQTFTESGTS